MQANWIAFEFLVLFLYSLFCALYVTFAPSAFKNSPSSPFKH
jgi:hypothetical protein